MSGVRQAGVMAAAVAVSWASMLAHNLYELPISIFALPNTGPLAAAVALLVAYVALPSSRVPPLLLFIWAGLNLVVGGILTVLPIPVLPFEPEQSASHYAAHLVYSAGQLPLLVLTLRATVRRGWRW